MPSQSLEYQTDGNNFLSEPAYKTDHKNRVTGQRPTWQYDEDRWQVKDKRGYKQLTRSIKDHLSDWKTYFKRNLLSIRKEENIPKKCSELYRHLDQLNESCVKWQEHLTGSHVKHQPQVSYSEGQRAAQTTKDDKTASSQDSHSGQRQQVATTQTENESSYNSSSSSSKVLQVEQTDELKALLEQERNKNVVFEEEIQNMQDELKNVQRNYKINIDKMNEMEQRIRKLKIEKEEALNRLSEMAGKKLLDNNPGIADLSTIIRPTKIAEMIKECYDNEWTDAFEELSNTGIPEKEIIRQLLKHFQDASMFCASMTEKFRNGLAVYVFDFPDKTDSLERQSRVLSKDGSDVIKQLQKATCTQVYRRLQDRFVESKPLGRYLETYVRKCIELTWYMCVQSPQMAIYCDLQEGDVFDNEKFSMFTQTGGFVDYLVWPCIQLHTNGPLLSKGVAQARRSRTATPETATSGENAEVHGTPDDFNTVQSEQIMPTPENEKDQDIQSKMPTYVNETSAGQTSENSVSDVRDMSNEATSSKKGNQKTVITVGNSRNAPTDKNMKNETTTRL